MKKDGHHRIHSTLSIGVGRICRVSTGSQDRGREMIFETSDLSSCGPLRVINRFDACPFWAFFMWKSRLNPLLSANVSVPSQSSVP